jgi:hypothetical protein
MSSCGQPTAGGPPVWGLSAGLTESHLKNLACFECYVRPRTGTDSERRKTGRYFGTCDVRSIYMTGSLVPVARELAKHNLGLAGVQEITRDKGDEMGRPCSTCFENFCWNT